MFNFKKIGKKLHDPNYLNITEFNPDFPPFY